MASRLGMLSAGLDLVGDETLAGLGSYWSVTGMRGEWERALSQYGDPSSELSRAGNLDALMRTFVANCGRPFTLAEIDEIKEIEADQIRALKFTAEAAEAAARLEDARQRLEAISRAVSTRQRFEDLNIPD